MTAAEQAAAWNAIHPAGTRVKIKDESLTGKTSSGAKVDPGDGSYGPLAYVGVTIFPTRAITNFWLDELEPLP